MFYKKDVIMSKSKYILIYIRTIKGGKMMEKKLSIVMPVYNEKDLILDVLKKVNEIKIDGVDIEIIVVDDCSTDGTREILKEEASKYANKVLYHEVNQGKGAALKTGFSEITGNIAIVQDADFEYDPMEIPSVIKPIIDGEADVVYGSRFLDSEYKGYKQNQLANKILTGLSNLMTGLKVTDMETCYKAFKREFIQGITIKSNRFDFEPEITAKIMKKKARLKEVPISYNGRAHSEGKKINWKYGIHAILTLIKYRFID